MNRNLLPQLISIGIWLPSYKSVHVPSNASIKNTNTRNDAILIDILCYLLQLKNKKFNQTITAIRIRRSCF